MAEAPIRYRISDLIRVAEEQTEKARQAYERAELTQEEFLNCLVTLEGLRMAKERGVPDSLRD